MGEQVVTNEQEAAMLGVHTLEWVGRICGIVTPYEGTGDYPVGSVEPCTECDSPVHAACEAVVRMTREHAIDALDLDMDPPRRAQRVMVRTNKRRST